MLTVMATDTDVTLLTARRLSVDEQGRAAEWFRPLGMVGIGAQTKLGNVRPSEVRSMMARRADGMFLGCNNQAWTITDDERAALVALEADHAARAAAFAAAHANDAEEYEAHADKIESAMTLGGRSY